MNKDNLERAMENKKEEQADDKEQKSLFDDSSVTAKPTEKREDSKKAAVSSAASGREKKKKRKWPLVILIVFLIVVLGGLFYWLFYLKSDLFKDEVTTTTSQTTTTQGTTTTTTKQVSDNYIYVKDSAGLNLRSEASATGEVLVIMPFGSKLKKVGEQGDWLKVVFEDKTGWCAKEFVTTEAPKELVYTNPDYGFQITFPAGWEKYKLFPISDLEGTTAAYYVALPTSESNVIAEGDVDAGYSSLFAISIFTPDQWLAAAADPFCPTKVAENAKYVVGYSLPNGTVPTDLEVQRGNAKTVVETLIFN